MPVINTVPGATQAVNDAQTTPMPSTAGTNIQNPYTSPVSDRQPRIQYRHNGTMVQPRNPVTAPVNDTPQWGSSYSRNVSQGGPAQWGDSGPPRALPNGPSYPRNQKIQQNPAWAQMSKNFRPIQPVYFQNLTNARAEMQPGPGTPGLRDGMGIEPGLRDGRLRSEVGIDPNIYAMGGAGGGVGMGYQGGYAAPSYGYNSAGGK
jgi:hypothetical protein